MIVEIDAGGRRVRAECTDSNLAPKDLLVDVLATWQATEGAVRPTEGPAYGFSSDRLANGVSPMNLRRNVSEPRAEEQ